MPDRKGKKWSREETILAYELYCRTPFSKIGKTNKDIIELASLLGRTPSSVGLKMANLAHYDSEIIDKSLVGMSHGSKLDKEICCEFADDWEKLSLEAKKIMALKKGLEVEKYLDMELNIEACPMGEEREAQIRQRVGQYFFRTVVLNAYSNRCCITGLHESKLLIASHIKPWKDCEEKKERTNPQNGLCLNALHDKAFDKGLITINSNYEVIISKNLKDVDMDENTREWFMGYEYKKIELPDKFCPQQSFIEYHNDVIFQG